jgi:hypothetical protein
VCGVTDRLARLTVDLAGVRGSAANGISVLRQVHYPCTTTEQAELGMYLPEPSAWAGLQAGNTVMTASGAESCKSRARFGDWRVNVSPSERIDEFIAKHPDWRGATLSASRRIILEVDPGIVEQWKYMGAPVWELDGIVVVGNIFRKKVKLGFMYGASLEDPEHLFNGELGGKQRRSYELYEGDELRERAFKDLVRAAIRRNRSK